MADALDENLGKKIYHVNENLDKKCDFTHLAKKEAAMIKSHAASLTGCLTGRKSVQT
jgi:hypothetical protein